MEEITRVRALCCECGNLRTVSAHHRSRKDDNRSGECDDDPRGWRVTGTLKCSVCGGKTRHALLRDDDPEFRDIAELGRHEQQLAIAAAALPPDPSLPAGAVRWECWEDFDGRHGWHVVLFRRVVTDRVRVLLTATQYADGSLGEVEINAYGLEDGGLNNGQARAVATALLEAADEMDGWAKQ
ncbi:MAG: DUF6315 family protein [Mycobacterium sp.]